MREFHVEEVVQKSVLHVQSRCFEVLVAVAFGVAKAPYFVHLKTIVCLVPGLLGKRISVTFRRRKDHVIQNA